MKKPTPKIRRYQQGGEVDDQRRGVRASTLDPNYMSKQINQGFDTTKQTIGMAGMIKKLLGSSGGDASSKSDSSYDASPDTSSSSGSEGGDTGSSGARKGGPIKRTMGPKLGREDGLIAAQKGEFVVRKSAAKKLGSAALNQINKGRLPQKKGR